MHGAHESDACEVPVSNARHEIAHEYGDSSWNAAAHERDAWHEGDESGVWRDGAPLHHSMSTRARELASEYGFDFTAALLEDIEADKVREEQVTALGLGPSRSVWLSQAVCLSVCLSSIALCVVVAALARHDGARES